MNCAYRLVWNEELNAWVVAPEIASARGKGGRVRRCAATLLLTLAIGSHATLAADLAATALPGGGQVAAGQATISSNGAAMTINQGSQRAIINWQNFDIGSEASVNFQQPNTSAVTLNRAGGPTASRIEGQLTANGQVFLVNPNGVLFGGGARVNVGGLVASTLNIRDADFLAGNYVFSGNSGSIINEGQITAAPGGYLAFISPSITNNGTINAPGGTVAMGAGERIRLNFAGDRLVGLDVSASAIDTLITNNQAIRAEGGAILLTAAGAEAMTRSVINNTGVLEASSLTSDGGRIVLTAGNDITLGAGSAVAVDGQKGGEITVQAGSGTLLADGALSARGAPGTGGTVRLLGHQVGLVNAAQVDASGATGGGTVNIGGSRQGTGQLASSRAVFIGADTRIDASATANGDGGTVIVYADDAARIYGHLSARGGPQGGHGGFIETSGKQYLDVLQTPDATALAGRGGEWLIDPNNIQIVTTAGTCTSLSGCAAGPNWATTNDSAQLGVNLINNALNLGQSVTVTTTTSGTNTQPGNITFQAGANIAKTAGGDATVTLSAHNDINTTGATISSTTGRLNVVLAADSDLSGVGNVVVGGNVTTFGGSLTATGVGISGAGAINTTGGASTNGGNITITGTSAAGSINLTGAMTTTGGTATAGSAGRSAGNVTINGVGAVTTGAITASGSNGNGANQAGGNGGAIAVTSNGTLLTGNLAASGGNGVATAAGGNSGSIAVTNNSTTAGTLTTGTLTARAGAAAGAIVSGAAGSVNGTNRAATLLQTGAIDTRGQSGGAGGNVALTSAGGVTVAGAIQASGGALNATTAAAGRTAGNVTIKGVNRSVAGAITASGGAAIVAGNAGGAGGNVLITGTDGTIATAGTLNTTGITARSGNAVGTVASGTAGSITLEATQINATGALDTRGGNNGAGGNVVLTSTGTLSINGAIATSGGTANASSAGRNAGNVTISGAGITSTAAGTITASGSGATTAGSNQPGGAGGAIQVSSTNGITLGAAVAASGGAATTTNANGGNAGSIAINNSGSGNISTTTLTASTGAGSGTGTGGNAGFISVTNAAAGGNLTTTGITTTGGAKGNGGNVTLSALGAVSTSNSNIITSGGAGIGSVGGSAGKVTISGGGVNLGTGTVTANGGAGNGANQAGGSGAAVQVTSTNGITANGAINATGGNGVTGNAAGGNSGSINIANSGAGTIQTGALAARNGAATGTGASGTVGGISVSNTAGNVTLGALTTSGQANGNGGNINVNATGLLTLNGAIATSGGTNVAATTQAGKHAGAVTLSGNGGITTAAAATIVSSGSAGLGISQAGGNAGAVSLTSSAGAISARAIASQTGAATGSGAGGAAGGITLNGTSVTTNAGALTTTGGANGNGGNITATAGTGLLNVGAITASGGAANANTAGRNAGAVTLTGDSVTTLGITANGTNGNTNGAGGNGGNVSVTGTANAVSVGAISTIGGNGVGGNSAGGNAGTITLDAGATTPTITLGGNLTATGGDRAGTGAAGSGGHIWLKDAVLVNAAAITASAQGGSLGVGAGANVRFDGTTNSTGGARALTVNTNAAAIFGGAVGGTSALASLTTNAGGTTSIGGNVTTTGAQTYNDAVTLAGNAVLTGTTPTFASTVAGGGFDLTLNFSGTTTVNGANFTGIRNLATGNGGTTQLTGAITTTGTQTYNDAVTLTGATTLASNGNGGISLNGTVDGVQTLAVNTTGTTTFAGAVGGATALTGLITNAGGTTNIGGNVTTTGTQTYNDAVTLTGGATRTFASTGNNALAFNGTVDGGSALVANTTGATTFAGAVGGATALASLTTNAGGTTSIGGNVTTTGAQAYNDAVTLAGNAVLTGTTPTFASTVAGGGFDLTLNFSGTTTVNGANFTGIRNLATGNGGATQLTGAITTTGTQTYNDAVTLTGATTLDSSGNGAIAFNGTVDGGQTLAVNTTGATTFAGAVGGTTALTSLTTNAGGTTVINGGSVRTSGNQTYGDNMSLGAPTTLVTTSNGSITANGSVAANGHLLTLAAGLGNVVMQNAANDLATVSVTSATNVALRDANAIDLGASTAGANLTVSAGGAVTDSGAISVAGATTINAGASNDVTLDNANDFGGNVSVQSARNARLNDINSLTLDLSAFGTLTATAAGTVTLAGQLTASGTGDATVLSGGRFVNSAGASALSVPAGSRWLVWSSNPNPFGGATPDNRGGLAYDFKQYNATYGVTPVARPTGNGFLYSLAPTVTAALTGTVSQVYDGNTTATLTAGNFNSSGAVDGDTLVLNATAATYDNKNVGTGKTVTATGITASASNGLAVVYGYSVSPNSASGAIGEITPAPLTVTAQTDNRVYNGTTSSAVAPVLAGATFDGVGTAATQTYDNKNVGTGKTLTASGLVMNDGNGGNNYAISYVADNTGVITAAPLTVTAQTDNRVYNGTTSSAVAPVVSGTTYDGVGTAATQTYDNKNVGTGKTLTASGLVMNDGNGGNNYAISYVADNTGVITAAPLTVTAQTDNRVYNGTTSSAVAPVLTGATYDAVGTAATQTYDNRNVGTGKTLTASGLVMNDGNGGNNYAISYVDNLSGQITPAALTLNAASDTKVYDGTTASTGVVTTSNLQSGDSFTASQSFLSKNVLGSNGSTLTVNAGYVVSDGNGGANYTVTTATAQGTITPASLTGSITASDKTYDSTTAATIANRSLTGVFGGDTVSYIGGTASFADKNAGTGKAVTATGLGLSGADAGNYTVNSTASTTANITPAALTVAANDATRPVNTPNPQFTATYAGFVGGETPAVLNGVLSFSTPATLTSPVGSYPITPYGQFSGNYTITYLDGKLTIQGTPVVALAFPREVVSQQAIGAQYTDPTMPSDTLSNLQFIFGDKRDAMDEKVAASVVRVIGPGIRLPN